MKKKDIIRAYLKMIGTIGGHNGAGIPKYRSPAENRRITRQAAAARWKGHKKRKV